MGHFFFEGVGTLNIFSLMSIEKLRHFQSNHDSYVFIVQIKMNSGSEKELCSPLEIKKGECYNLKFITGKIPK